MQIVANRLFTPCAGYPDSLRQFLSHERGRKAWEEISAWPGYAATPLVDLVDLAEECRVARVLYKDEGGRFGLGSFKALGGAHAVARLMKHRAGEGALTVCCATDGNHGRSVAWGAQRLGCRCVIYLHEGVSQERERAIVAFGAEIRRVVGNYDDSVRAAERDAKVFGWTVVSDTSYAGYSDIPCDVMQGYTVMVEEILQSGFVPTHVFVQGGVGGLAAAVCAHFWEAFGAHAPRVIVVEPDAADCLFQSARAGRPVAVHGTLSTIMAGLACGEVSAVAWRILSLGASHFVTISDESAIECMQYLARGARKFPPIVAGESATAGLAAFRLAAKDAAIRESVGIDEEARVLCIGSEGDSDPDIYHRLVGMHAKEVRSRAARWT